MPRAVHFVRPLLAAVLSLGVGLAVHADDDELPIEDAIAIEAGTPATGQLVRDDFVLENGSLADVFSLQVREGQRFQVSLTSENFDTHLYVLDSELELIAENDDADGPGSNSRLQFTATASGTVYILASSWLPNTAGDYTVLASEIEE